MATLELTLDEEILAQPLKRGRRLGPPMPYEIYRSISDTDVQAILDHRPNPADSDTPDPIFQTPAWLITEANLTPQKVQALDRYITARSQVYRVQSIGYLSGGGPVARVEAVVDTNAGRPRVIFWRDLTQLRRGFNLQTAQ